jgi:Mn2+/Fe2+ NRAMP family transporter
MLNPKSAIRNPQSAIRNRRSVLLGAASLMATSAIGPGFLTQTAVFTAQFRASFGFIVLLSILIGLAAQLNIWRIIGVSGLRGQEIANRIRPGLGGLIAGLVCLGGFAFNIGNVAGAGLGLNAAIGLDVKWGAALSAGIGIALFLNREAGRLMDALAKFLGAIMIVLTAYVATITHPPAGQAFLRTFIPETFSLFPVITLVGGTVGGYITFSGAHRLLDAGITGRERLSEISRSASTAILIVAVMRFLLFFAFLGVVARGCVLDPANPPASAFRAGAGELGYHAFGIILWCAAITSVIGSAYTSVSFLRTLRPVFERHQSKIIIAFIAISALVFIAVGQPVKLLVLAGALNGLILPVTLGAILLAAGRRDIVAEYNHPGALLVAGYLAVLAALVAGYFSLRGIADLWR